MLGLEYIQGDHSCVMAERIWDLEPENPSCSCPINRPQERGPVVYIHTQLSLEYQVNNISYHITKNIQHEIR